MWAARSSPRGAAVPTDAQRHVSVTQILKRTKAQAGASVTFTHHINDYEDPGHGVTSEKDPQPDAGGKNRKRWLTSWFSSHFLKLIDSFTNIKWGHTVWFRRVSEENRKLGREKWIHTIDKARRFDSLQLIHVIDTRSHFTQTDSHAFNHTGWLMQVDLHKKRWITHTGLSKLIEPESLQLLQASRLSQLDSHSKWTAFL